MTATEPPFRLIQQFRANPAYPLGIVGLGLGFLLNNIQGAVLGGVIGYFVGKTIQSFMWTFSSEDHNE